MEFTNMDIKSIIISHLDRSYKLCDRLREELRNIEEEIRTLNAYFHRLDINVIQECETNDIKAKPDSDPSDNLINSFTYGIYTSHNLIGHIGNGVIKETNGDLD